MTTPGRWSSLFAVAVLALVPGCLEFKKQTVLVKFDEKTDGITILSVYEEFYATRSVLDSPKSALKDATDGLTKFVGDKPCFVLLSNWIGLQVSPDSDDSPETAAVKRRLATVVEIGRVNLLLNEAGKLGGDHTITIRDRKKFEDVVNELFSEVIAKQDQPHDPNLSDESIRLLKKAAAEGHRWLTIAPGQWVVDWPLAPEDADKFLGWIKVDRKGREDFAAFREAVGTFDLSKTDHGLSATFGDGKSRLITIRHDDKDSHPAMEAELLEFARTLPTPIDRSQDTKAVIGKFRSTR